MALTADEIGDIEPVLHAYALRAVGNRDAARDLVQETLLAALAGRERFEGRAKLRTWAVRILTNKVVDLVRARGRSRARDEDVGPDDLAEPTSERRPDRVLARRQALGIVDRALRELPELERLAVLLVDVEGFDRGEAAVKLDITANHLRVLLHRGRHRVRRALETADEVTDAP